ncbi:occludin/ELL domain-containing protein 1 isoform X2 [Antechinus flavipes]|uniref:occludin/ELL domain-containing protein 1 isoform X2 n=1 Tax=Antechinus flavipes TaxID=38775 RepID=UPI002235F57B|nr:occludin/ELL domain-containing protein 1 isoform X2 [Antechinus flavipes]
MQTRVSYTNIHKAPARPLEPRPGEWWEGQSHPRGVCSRAHRAVSQGAGPAHIARAPRRDEGKPPGARRVRCSVTEKLRAFPPAQSSQGIQSSGQGPRGRGYSPRRVPRSLQRPAQTVPPSHHFVSHTGKKFLLQGKRGAPKSSSGPPVTYRLPSRPTNPETQGHCQPRPRKIVFEDELPVKTPKVIPGLGPQPGKGPTGSGPTLHSEHTPQPQLVPDYILRYPAISSAVERSRYKAVFQDQHPEYLELHQDVATAMAKFQELEALLATLPRLGPKDPVFLEKQARCDYLKRKLRHLKAQIQKYDEKDSQDGSVYF